MMFANRQLVIATMHQKEKAIAPMLEKVLGVKCIVTNQINTDTLGTFTGEVDREFDPITTAKKKCKLAMELTGCDLAVASEGSFGPHPLLYFIPSDEEYLILIDKKNDIEIIVKELSTETNYNGTEIKSIRELNEFAIAAKFPSHALIIKNRNEGFTEITKGIENQELLENTFQQYISKYCSVYVETDMRAMYNPSRMKVIEQATEKLIQAINSLCPNCQTPGFVVTDVKQGLRCEQCNFPTKGILSNIYTCKKCSYTEEKKHPNGKFTEDPMYCDVCNP